MNEIHESMKGIVIRQANSEKSGNEFLYIESLIKLQRFDECYDYLIKHDSIIPKLQRKTLIAIGNHKFQSDEYHEALIMYSQINNDPDQLLSSIMKLDDRLLLNLAHCHQQLNDPQNALKCYYKYLEHHNDDVICINNIATISYYHHKYSEALVMYNRMTLEHIQQNGLHFHIGVCQHHCNDWQSALHSFQQHLKSSNKNRDHCLIYMACIYSKKLEDYRNALQCYHKVKGQTIAMKGLEFDIAWCHQQNDQYAEALQFYIQYLRKHPNNVSTLHNIAWIYLNADDDQIPIRSNQSDHCNDQKNDDANENEITSPLSIHSNYRRAKPLLLKILRIDKSHFWANWTLGTYLRDIESNYSLALQCLLISLTAQPQSIQILIDIAKVHKLMGDMHSAKTYYMRAIAVDESDCFANLEYAHFCALIGRYKLSYLHYRNVLHLIHNKQCDEAMLENMNMEQNYVNYGHVLHKLGKHREAIAFVKRALELNPTDTNTLNNLGYYCYILGEFEESEQYLRECLRLDSKHEFTNSTLGMLLFDTNRWDEAVTYFEVAMELESDTESAEIAPKMMYKYGSILFDAQEYQKCIRILHRIVEGDAFSGFTEMEGVFNLLSKSYDAMKCTKLAMEWRSKANGLMKVPRT